MLIIFNILHYYLYSVSLEREELGKAQVLYHFMIQKYFRSTDSGR
jgi:hypothetical protein